jgi:hypothetical protein
MHLGPRDNGCVLAVTQAGSGSSADGFVVQPELVREPYDAAERPETQMIPNGCARHAFDVTEAALDVPCEGLVSHAPRARRNDGDDIDFVVRERTHSLGAEEGFWKCCRRKRVRQ